MVTKRLAHVLVFGLRNLIFYQKFAATIISEVVYIFVATWEREQLLFLDLLFNLKILYTSLSPFLLKCVPACMCVCVERACLFEGVGGEVAQLEE